MLPVREKEFRIQKRYVTITAFAVIFSWLIHELAHWSMGEVLGNTMAMTLNSSYPVLGDYIAPSHAPWIDAAGPLVTIALAVLSYILLLRNFSLNWLPFLLTGLYMRLLAGVMNVIHLNDEGRLSHYFGIGTFTLSILVVGTLGFLTYRIAKVRNISLKLIALTFILILLFSSALILSDQFFKVRLL